MGDLQVDYKIHGFEDLRLHMNAGMDLGSGESNKVRSPYNYDSGTYYYGNKGWNTMDTYNLSLSMYAQYTKEFNKNHYLDVMGGYEWQQFHKETDYFLEIKNNEFNYENKYVILIDFYWRNMGKFHI